MNDQQNLKILCINNEKKLYELLTEPLKFYE